ncbi:MAG: hydrolase [Parvularculaceae bacterium]
MGGKTDISKDLAFLDGRRGAMAAALGEWCAINTGSFNLDGLAAMRAALQGAFAELGADIEEVACAPQEIVTAAGEVKTRTLGACLRVVKRPQAPVRVLLAGHMDTVFAPDHPFQSARLLDADTLNAPGGADMKGGLLVMLNALMAVEHSRFAERIGYEVILNADEEIGSPGSASILQDAARRAQFAMVYEPAMADGTLAGARKGSGNFAAVFRGRAAHAGRDPAAGRNAVAEAARFAASLDAMNGAHAGLTVNVAKIDGGGPNNVVPDNAVVRFNARVEKAEDAEWFLAETQARLSATNARDGFHAHLHGGFARPPKPMTPQLEAFFRALKACGLELGLDIGWKASGGVCDGNNIAAAGVPVIDTLGARGGAIHSADEFVKLDSLEERAKLSALLLLRIAAGDIPNPGARAA